MALPLSVAKQLLKLSGGAALPASQLNPKWRELLVEEGILVKQAIGRTRYRIKLISNSALQHYLVNQHHIKDLAHYVSALESGGLTGVEAQTIASDTKLRQKASFSGFLVTSVNPVKAVIKDQRFTIHPPAGSFMFIEDYNAFTIPEDVTVVGIENPENFKNLSSNHNLVAEKKPLFVCRYPQSNALINWLKQIPNPYLHFGDFDLAGVVIFEREFRKQIGNRASLFIPNNIGDLIKNYGNRKLYDQQYKYYRNLTSGDSGIQELVALIHKWKKGLEQEFFIKTKAKRAEI